MSEQMATFNEVLEKHFEKLDLYTTAITRAHGENHPEAFEIRELFEKISKKREEAGTNTPNVDEELARLRDITNDYTVPDDVCGTYEGVFNMLSEADKAYRAS